MYIDIDRGSRICYFLFHFIIFSSLNASLTETNSLWLIYESTKAIEIRTSIVSNLAFPSSTILSCFFFLITGLYTLIPAVIEHIFSPTPKFVIAAGTESNKVNAEIETQAVIVEV